MQLLVISGLIFGLAPSNVLDLLRGVDSMPGVAGSIRGKEL
jgi:hypothetical protein